MSISKSYQRDAEIKIAETMANYHADPWGFVMFAFPWGRPGTDLADFPDGPDQWQIDLFLAMAEHVQENMRRKAAGQSQKPFRAAVASGHGIGKSACVAWLILWLMSTRVGCRGIVTANTADQLQTKTWPELAKWHQLAINRDWFTWTATQFYYTRWPESRRKNYCFDAVTWSEERTEGFAGLHNATSAVGIIFDEASAIPDRLWEVASGAMTDGEPFFFAFGNPTRNTGRFHEAFNRLRNYWWTRNIDSRSVRITNKEYLDELVEQYGEESDYIRVRIRGQFPAGGDTQFIPNDVVDIAREREAFQDLGAPLILGVDVARFGDDKTVMVMRRGQDAKSFPILKFRNLDLMQTAALVAETVATWNPSHVFVDGVGVGGGVVDRLRQMGIRIHDVNAGGKPMDPSRYMRRRDEMWGRMRDWLVKHGAIADDDELYTDLIAPQYSFTDKQQIRLERKDDMKRRGLDSPDIADALALTFATTVAHEDMKTGRGRTWPMARNVDYDLFSYGD